MPRESVANGPEGRTDWDAVNWRKTNRLVSNLRRRIFRAGKAGDLNKVRSLQKLMLRCRANALVSVRRVTQVNAGKYTPGVDKLVVKTPAARGELVDRLLTQQPWKAKPARRVYIPKSNGKLRPLGIPTVTDRCLQARVRNALEPYWESQFEGTSYGFRPGRGCHDAIARIFTLATPNRRRKWVVDADIKGAFDNIGHDFLLAAIGECPGRELVKQWLKAGVMEDGVFHATEWGTPQGGVISPLLLNIALHGMEQALGVRHTTKGCAGPRMVVRYADDFVVFCRTQEDAQLVKDQILPAWLAVRGLNLSEEKTRIVHLTEGFDFLGFTVKHYKSARKKAGYKLLITPSRKSVAGKREELREVWRQLRGQNVATALWKLNPIVRGWANYFRIGVSSKVFTRMDAFMYHRQLRYVKRAHHGKSRAWRQARYWGRLNEARNDYWVFGDKHTGKFMVKFSWTTIRRHVLVKGTASPDDPSLRDYWWERRRVNIRKLTHEEVEMALDQDWVCPVCGENLFNGEELHRHHRTPRHEGGQDTRANRELVHLYCHHQRHAQLRRRRGHERMELTRK